MKGRHLKMSGSLIAFLLIAFWLGIYLYVAFHYGHIFSFFICVPMQFLAIMIPGVFCDGYDMRDPYHIIDGTSHPTVDSYMTCRETGYALGFTMYIATYVISAASWFRGSTTMYAVLWIYGANLCMGLAFVVIYTLLLVTYSQND